MKKEIAPAIAIIIFLLLSLKVEAGISCKGLFKQRSNQFYSFEEVIETFRVSGLKEKDNGQNEGGLYAEFAVSRNFEKVEFLELEGLEFRRLEKKLPQSKIKKEVHPPLADVRNRFFQKWGKKKISLQEVSISRVSKLPVEKDFSLAELSNGQLVFVTEPLSKTKTGKETKIHYEESHLIEYELFKAGLTPFLALGKGNGGEYRLVRPIFKGYEETLMDFGLDPVYKQVLNDFVQLEKVELPVLSQFFRSDVIEPISYYATSTIRLGRYTDKRDVSIVGLERAGLKSWEIDLEAGRTLSVPVRFRSADDFIGMHHIFRGVVLSNISPKLRLLEVKKMYDAGKLYDVLMAIYVDLLLYGADNKSKLWRNSSFQAKIDDSTSFSPLSWGSEKSLKIHFKKHGKKEMALENKEEYLEMAIDFFRSSEGPSISVRRQGTGDYFKYNFETREFGILGADLKIVTYYILNSSYRQPIEFQDYLSEQLKR